MMRVIAGKYGSRELRSLRGVELRPTSDRLRETLFNIIGPAAGGAVFVDLYAGSGAVGIEALSRGADHVVFVERHAAAVKLIRSNLNALGIELAGERPGRPRLVASSGGRAMEARRATTVEFPGGEAVVELLAQDAVKALGLLHRRRLLADFVYVDPPYAEAEEYERALAALSSGNILAPAARVIVEMARPAKRPPERRAAASKRETLPPGMARAARHDHAAVTPLPVRGWQPPARIGALEQTRIVEQGDSLLVFYRVAVAA